MGVRHVHGRGLVANVDDADAELRGMVPDRLDMAALQPKDAIDAALLQEPRDPSRARIVIGIEVLGGRRHLVPPETSFGFLSMGDLAYEHRFQFAMEILPRRGARHLLVAHE